MPRFPDGTPAGGVPRFPDGTPARGVPQVRGGHPEQRESGGGWGAAGQARTGAGPASGASRTAPGVRLPGPRQEYLEAFDDDDVFAPGAPHKTPGRAAAPGADPFSSVTDWDQAADGAALRADAPEEPGDPGDGRDGTDTSHDKGGRGRTFTGVAAAAVTTVLAVVVAGQVTDNTSGDGISAQAADADRGAGEPASRSDERPTPSQGEADSKPAPATYAQKMGKKVPLDADLRATGEFDAIAGLDRAPGKGQVFRYRVDVEKGLGLDGELFAQAVQKTLNDERSWAHGGGRTFERVSSGQPDFVITLASPGTTADWCAKSGLDTTEDNVSCDSAATDRVMINAYRWAQGAKTYGDEIYAYRQMLINHEVGHRLGFNHVNCTDSGALAPVMQQQTKFLTLDGVTCKPNPWAFPAT